MKIITFYLPQFHQIPENDEWWGEGFTEWTNMKKAKPLYLDHYMPRIPQNNNYYDLSRPETLQWQSDLAKKYGVYGFAFYHYWFNGKKLLEKPLELLLSHPEIEQKYCISWANEHWTNGWVSDNNTVLISHDNRDRQDWDRHFYYLLPFFRDPRYIREEGKPVIILYFPDILQHCNQMINRWRYLAKENGLPGLFVMYQKAMSHYNPLVPHNAFDGGIEFHPGYVNYHKLSTLAKRKAELRFYLSSIAKLKFKIKPPVKKNRITSLPQRTDYDNTWADILSLKPDNLGMYPGAFVDWDNTPRKGNRGSIIEGATPDKFQRYMTEQIRRTRDVYHKDMLFLFAWNEWAEGGYLEPDEKYGTQYLEAIYNALQKNDEFPEFN